jgi:hypothetical protein
MTRLTSAQRTKIRYRLHWAGEDAPFPSLKWVIYDWKLICRIAYLERREVGREVCALLNQKNRKVKRARLHLGAAKTLLASIDAWCEDRDQTPVIELICETIRPQVVAMLSAQPDVKEPR